MINVAKKHIIATLVMLLKRDYNRIENSKYIKPTPNGDPLYYEKIYTPLVESSLTRVISNIVAASTLSLPCQKVLYSSTKKELSRIIITQWLRTPKARLLFDEIGEDPFNRVIADTKDLIINHFPTDKQKQYLDELMKVEYTEDLKKSLELDLTTSEDYILVHLRWHILGTKNFSIFRSFYLF